MEILEVFDLTGTLRGAAELAGCDHKTVAHGSRRATRRVAVVEQAAAARESKGGSEATVRVAKADLVPTDHNLRGGLGVLRRAGVRV